MQALLLNELRKEMPKMTGKERKQKELIATLEEVFFKVSTNPNPYP